MTIILEAQKRHKVGKLDSLRQGGLLPAVFYGHKEASTPIQIKKTDFIKTWKKAGESSVITISIEGANKDALIHDVSIDAVTGEPVHADFYVFEKGHKVEVDIPLEFIGVSPAVKELSGTLVKVLHEIKVEAEPANLPHKIEVDVSSLVDFDSTITAGSLVLPKGVALVDNPEDVVVAVSGPKAEEEEAAPAIDLSQIEVEKKGKQEEEGEAAA